MSYHSEESASGEYLGEAVAEIAKIGIVTAGYHAYKAHKQRTGDTMGSLYQAALTARRWWVWTFFLIAGVVMTSIMAWGLFWIHYVIPHNDYMVNRTPETGTTSFGVTAVAVYLYGWLILGITYCRNIDSGLHKRRWAYRRLRGLYLVTQFIPSFFLYLSIPMVQLLF